MPDLLIRNLSPKTHGELKRRADLEGLSLQAYVTRLLTASAERPTRGEWLEQLDRLDPISGVSGSEAVEAARDELP